MSLRFKANAGFAEFEEWKNEKMSSLKAILFLNKRILLSWKAFENEVIHKVQYTQETNSLSSVFIFFVVDLV